MVKKILLGLVALTAGAEAHRLNLRGKSSMSQEPGLCGKGYDSLNDGTKDYFDTIEQNLWTHPGNGPAFGVFKSDLQCWFAKMIDGNCGGMQPNAERKKQLYADCNDVSKDYLNVWKSFSDPEFKYFKQTFPSDPEGEFYSESMTTMKELAKKEVLCTTLFTIDDGCVAFKYVKKA